MDTLRNNSSSLLRDTHRAELLRINPRIAFDADMRQHTTFRIGGPADALWSVQSAEELAMALEFASAHQLPLTILGNGSNILVRDGGIRGVTLKIYDDMRHAVVEGRRIRAESGILLSQLSQLAAHHSLSGLAFAAGIPGTLGGASAMNAGAYGGEMADIILELKALKKNGELLVIQRDDLCFGYRRSAVIDLDLIITEVLLELSPGDKSAIRQDMQQFNAGRREKQPLNYPSAGSTFKRPEGHFAGHLIEISQLKGRSIGDAQVSELHAGFIINTGSATARDVLQLITLIQEEVLARHNVLLEPEIHIIGEG